MTEKVQTKGALRSKGFLGAVATIAGVLLVPTVPGLDYNPDTQQVIVDLPTVLGSAAGIAVTTLVPGGGILAGIGRMLAKGPIRGLW